MKVRTRIAPSPTGIAHVGTAYQALISYAYATKEQGDFIIRIEDTDQSRFVEGAEQLIYDGLKWLGIPHAEGSDIGGPFAPYKQSERLPLYAAAAKQLVESGAAYPCFCSQETLDAMRKEQQECKEIPRYDRRCLKLSKEEVEERLVRGDRHVIRMKMPEDEVIAWNDLVRGQIEINSKELDDQVLVKSDGYPTYHLAVVVDDHAMEITHIFRGEEWISSTPKHILLYRAFGWDMPSIGHLPLLRNVDKSKMSKRKNDVSIPSYKAKGYLPEALRNYLCLLGWSHPEEKDIFDLAEFIRLFTIERVVKNAPIFDLAKLNWMNGKYIREVISTEALLLELKSFLPTDYPAGLLEQVLPLIRERLVTLKDIEPLTEFFYRPISLNKTDLLGKNGTVDQAKEYLTETIKVLSASQNWAGDSLEIATREMCDARGWNRGAFFMVIRVALTGRSVTPPLFATIEVLGRELTLERLQMAISMLQ